MKIVSRCGPKYILIFIILFKKKFKNICKDSTKNRRKNLQKTCKKIKILTSFQTTLTRRPFPRPRVTGGLGGKSLSVARVVIFTGFRFVWSNPSSSRMMRRPPTISAFIAIMMNPTCFWRATGSIGSDSGDRSKNVPGRKPYAPCRHKFREIRDLVRSIFCT